jgi:hypothetical protein
MSLTLAESADAVGVSVSFLESLGLREEQSRGETHLVIPYYNPDGTLFRERLRLCLKPRDESKDKKFLWGKLLKPDDKTCLYGLQRLEDAVAANTSSSSRARVTPMCSGASAFRRSPCRATKAGMTIVTLLFSMAF